MNIIITGASRGIGKQVVLQLANNGHQVIAISRNETILKELEKANDNVIAFPFDLIHGDYQELSNFISDKKLTIDGLLNNAGQLVNKPFLEIKQADLQGVFGANVFGPFLLIQSILPFMFASTMKHIVNISSMGGFQGSVKFSGLSAYSASKAAIACLTECLAEELREHGVKVNALAIGAVETEMLQEAFPGYEAPLKASEMADYICHFMLKQHTFFNGKVLPVSLSTP